MPRVLRVRQADVASNGNGRGDATAHNLVVMLLKQDAAPERGRQRGRGPTRGAARDLLSQRVDGFATTLPFIEAY